MRAALANYRPYTQKFHLLSSDFRLPGGMVSAKSNYPENWRLGQFPQWLNCSKRAWADEDVELNPILQNHVASSRVMPEGTFVATGFAGQLIAVVPSHELVVVRLAKDSTRETYGKLVNAVAAAVGSP